MQAGNYYKDLTRLGRDLSKTLIVDNWPEMFKEQPENGIHILTWTGNQADKKLIDLEPVLAKIVETQVEDVR
jgi:CTD small phosphatase-like protein 2